MTPMKMSEAKVNNKLSALSDLEVKDNASIAVADQSSVPEYERFLHLENTLDGQKKRKLIRKRELIPSTSYCQRNIKLIFT